MYFRGHVFRKMIEKRGYRVLFPKFRYPRLGCSTKCHAEIGYNFLYGDHPRAVTILIQKINMIKSIHIGSNPIRSDSMMFFLEIGVLIPKLAQHS